MHPQVKPKLDRASAFNFLERRPAIALQCGIQVVFKRVKDVAGLR
jgi:hypothetical protein